MKWEVTEHQQADPELTALGYTVEQQQADLLHILEFDFRKKQMHGHDNIRKYMNSPELWNAFCTTLFTNQSGNWNGLEYKRTD